MTYDLTENADIPAVEHTTVVPSRDIIDRGMLRALNREMLWSLGFALTIVTNVQSPFREALKAEGLSDEAVGRIMAHMPDHWLVVKQGDVPIESGLSPARAREKDEAWARWRAERLSLMGRSHE